MCRSRPKPVITVIVPTPPPCPSIPMPAENSVERKAKRLRDLLARMGLRGPSFLLS